MKQFDHRFTVRASLERVIDFHKDIRTLKKLTPPPLFITFNKAVTGSSDATSDFNIWFGPFPVHWVAAITEEVDNPGFLDRQLVGPFEFWAHRHTFRKIDSQSTQIVDTIEAKPGKRLLAGLISRFMWLTLPALFAFRTWRTRRELEVGRT